MIEVIIQIKGERDLAHIQIERVEQHSDGADYSIRFAVDTGDELALYQRSVYAFPRKQLNVLALLRLALETLEEKELSLDRDPDAPRTPNLARRLGRSLFPF